MAVPNVFAYTIQTGAPVPSIINVAGVPTPAPAGNAGQGEIYSTYAQLLQTGACVLIAGTIKVGFGGDLAPIVLTPRSKVWFQTQTIGGVAGTHYVVTAELDGPLDPAGVPTGFFVVQAQDTAGALVATDTSTLQWFVMG